MLSTNRAWISELVPHTGFEPVISALRGRCPRPLDECGAVQVIRSGAEYINAPLEAQDGPLLYSPPVSDPRTRRIRLEA